MLGKVIVFLKENIGKKLVSLLFFLAFVCEFISLCTILLPFLIERFIEQIQIGVFSLYYPLRLVVSYLLIFLLQSVIVWFYGRLQLRAKVQLQLSIFDDLLVVNPTVIRKNGEGFFTSLMEESVETVLNLLSPNSLSVFFKIFQNFIIIGILFYKNTVIGIIAILLFSLYFVAFVLNNKLFSTILIQFIEKNSDSISKIYDFIKGNKVLLAEKEYRDFAHKRVSDILQQVQKIEFKLQYCFELIFSTLGSFIQPCSNVIVIGILGKNVITGNLTFGTFVLIITYFNILQNGFDSFQKIADLIFHTSGALDSLTSFTEKKLVSFKELSGNEVFFIKFENVNKSYENNIIFGNVTITLGQNNNYGLIGSSGSGKSCFINSVLGFEQPDSGVIKFLNDNQNVASCLPVQKIACLLQTSEIFNLNLQENIFLSDVFDKKEFDLLVKEFELEKLTDRTFGSGGSFISGGERQKVLLARFVHQLKNKKYYILDEPLTGMDVLLKKRICESLKEHLKGKTGICITHDQYILDNLCNKLLLFNNHGELRLYENDEKNIEKILLSEK